MPAPLTDDHAPPGAGPTATPARPGTGARRDDGAGSGADDPDLGGVDHGGSGSDGADGGAAGPKGPGDPTVGDRPPTDEDDRTPGWSRAQWLVLGVAVAFLVGAAGYFVGVRTASPPSSAVDEGFLVDMTAHHDQAVEMALLGTSRAGDPVVRDFANEVLLFQRRELGLMQAYLDERGVQPPEYDPERLTMAWMDMPRPLAQMSGMATEEQMQELADLTGADFDQRFLELLSEHHAGGVHMAEYAATQAADPKVRLLADRMARNQAAEIPEYQRTLDRLRGGA